MGTTPRSFVEYLRQFNRKERFFLLGWCLGNRDFSLSAGFRRTVSSMVAVDVPSDAFVAMDYHLDWLYASAFLASSGRGSHIHPNTHRLISANQEDIDLLIAFRQGRTWHVIMVEAKAATGWTNKQAASKALRLKRIFGQDGKRYPSIRPHFILTSPRESKGLDATSWPDWMKRRDGAPFWIEMPFPSGLFQTTRCDRSGRVSAEGTYWKTVASRG